MHGAVELENISASGTLMKTVDILCNHGGKLADIFKTGKKNMSWIRLSVRIDHMFAVKAEEILGMFFKEVCRKDFFGRKSAEILQVKSVRTSEVGDAAFGGNSRASEKYDFFAVFNKLSGSEKLIQNVPPDTGAIDKLRAGYLFSV